MRAPAAPGSIENSVMPAFFISSPFLEYTRLASPAFLEVPGGYRFLQPPAAKAGNLQLKTSFKKGRLS